MKRQDKKTGVIGDPALTNELRRLIRTPVGRRLLLKLGGASALTMAIGDLGGCGDDGEEGPIPTPTSTPTPTPTATPTPTERPREVRHLFCALGSAAGAENLTLSVGGVEYPVELITDAHRQDLVALGGVWSMVDTARLTHVARNVDLPSDRPLLLHVTGQLGGNTVYVAETIHVPRESLVFAWTVALALAGSDPQRLGVTRWAAELGVSLPEQLNADDLADLTATITPSSIAAALVYKHPEIVSLESDSAAITMTLLLASPGVSDLAAQIAQMLQQGIPYAEEVPVLDENGDQVYLQDPDGTVQVPANTVEISSDLDDRFNRAVRLGVNDMKNSMELEGKTWFLTPGTPPQPIPVGSVVLPADDLFAVTLDWTGFKHGIKIEKNGDFEPSTRQLPIKVWNNYVRYTSVYVQYLDGQGNLIVPPSAAGGADGSSWREAVTQGLEPLSGALPVTGSNTKYSTYVTEVPDMPTLFGIPIAENTNYSEATLTFPAEARTARVLVGGLGHSPDDGGWKNLFPAGAYPDRINPPECEHGIIMTSILDIGVVTLFLVMDVGATSVTDTYRAMSRSGPYNIVDVLNSLRAIVKNLGVLSPALALAAGVASGEATLEDISSGRGKSTWWALLKMAEVLARLISTIVTTNNRVLEDWMKPILVNMAVGNSSRWIPVVGEALAAAAVVGDIAQLAETSAEVATSPWLIDNSIHVTYGATVTLYHDPDDAVFPRSATKYALTPVIGGGRSRDPIVGDVTPVGTRSDPIVVLVNDIPIGGTVQYSVSFTNADGAQVGTGATDVLPNNDVNNLPRTVEITIQEIAIPITANTVFERQNTTAYSTADNGYTWTTNTQIGGTVQDHPGLLEINSISVGTVSGMAGYVWRTQDPSPQYWIRNLPTIQNEGQKTIKLQTGGPYSRKPLVVYDRLNPDLTNGNNFLLEPYEQGTGYQVRRLKLSADGGRLGWNVGESWGQFLNPLSAVTLHPSGYLVGVNAQTGKLDIHQIPPNPTQDTSLPPLASSHAGPGTRPGLTQTPVGVAITITGVIVILEAGANQLQSFDLNGNPVAYFGTDPNNLSYYAALASGANDTLLSLAVDGQGWFYVLSYTGDGSQVSDYAVDVYNAQGEHIVRSPGLNAATFDVDYWRNVFTLNYASVKNTDGTARIDPTGGFMEPSTSICIPRNR
jgi:hypothetical protein